VLDPARRHTTIEPVVELIRHDLAFELPVPLPPQVSGQLVAMGQVSYRLLEPWPEGSNSPGNA
jgi:hypothetical protein